MLYHSSERATPARLSYEQYNDFETFLRSSKRKLLWQAALIFSLAIVVIVAAIYFLGFDVINNEQYETNFTFGFLTIWMLPVLIKIWESKRLYQKPTQEPTLLPEGVVAPLSNREMVDRRFMGMSEGLAWPSVSIKAARTTSSISINGQSACASCRASPNDRQ
ncbi:MAG: hypothetical protein V3U65_09155 [Granulosicoccaceae bacterium]